MWYSSLYSTCRRPTNPASLINAIRRMVVVKGVFVWLDTDKSNIENHRIESPAFFEVGDHSVQIDPDGFVHLGGIGRAHRIGFTLRTKKPNGWELVICSAIEATADSFNVPPGFALMIELPKEAFGIGSFLSVENDW